MHSARLGGQGVPGTKASLPSNVGRPLCEVPPDEDTICMAADLRCLRVGGFNGRVAVRCFSKPFVGLETEGELGGSLCFFVWWTGRTGEILRPDLFNVELRRTFPHGFEHVFEAGELALDPTERVDACHHKRSQIWAN